MKELSENAKLRLDKYINEVKFSLKGCKSVEPDDIISDIYEHIEGELAEIEGPISIDDFEETRQPESMGCGRGYFMVENCYRTTSEWTG